ncbi:MAG: universal stress protein [Deltaproteobacteria bacterium]|nr:MAG: universal stress protein [Deltaproteobacteria bacterium]
MSQQLEANVPPYVIVAAVDGSDMTDVVLQHAIDLARRHDRAVVHVVGVVSIGRGIFAKTSDQDARMDEMEAHLRARAEEATADLAADQGVHVTLHVRAGVPWEEILDVAAETEAHLIVLGRHGWGGRRSRLVGSVSERIARMAPCSVWLVQPPDYAAYRDEEAREEPCAACVEARRTSNGEVWFCEAHRAGTDERRFTTIVSGGGYPIQPGFGLF